MEIAEIYTVPEIFNVIKVLATGIIAFVFAFTLIPFWTKILYKYKIGIKIKSTSVSGEKLTYISTLQAKKSGTPTMGGLTVWFSVLLLVYGSHYLFPLIAIWTGMNFFARLDFFNPDQVYLPLFTLVMTGVLGLFDDIMSVRGWGDNKGGGMRFAKRFWWLIVIASYGAWWFYAKLGWDTIHVPAFGSFEIGLWYIPIFISVILFTVISSNETDGMDGLNAGILVTAFSSFSVIAFFQNQVDLSAFCVAITGALLAFLWFNIYPARFFMGDTGASALGATLGVVALLTDSVLVLFIIVFIYVLESASVVIQIMSKKLFKRKVFLAAPIHHHFEAKGWPEPKVVMRAWVFTAVTAIVGLLIGILGMG